MPRLKRLVLHRLMSYHRLLAEWPEARIQPSGQFHRKQLTMIGSCYYNKKHFDSIVEILQRNPWIDEIVTHRFPLGEAKAAYDLFCSGRSGKVVLET